MCFRKLFGGRALRRETNELNALIEFGTRLLTDVSAEPTHATIPQALADRCQTAIQAAQNVLDAKGSGSDLETLQRARTHLNQLVHEVSIALYESSGPPDFIGGSLQDVIDHAMETHQDDPNPPK